MNEHLGSLRSGEWFARVHLKDLVVDPLCALLMPCEGFLQRSSLHHLHMRGRALVGANMLQFTQIAAGHCLGHHYDRRDKWSEGIASVAWSDIGNETDARGEDWTLSMQSGEWLAYVIAM